jgi:hypothetical protein
MDNREKSSLEIKRFLPQASTYLALIGNTAVVLYALATYSNLAFWQASARFTGRISLLLFILLFINRLKKLISFREENWLFGAFAISHLIHLFFLLYYNALKGGLHVNIRILGGIIGYGLAVLTPLVSLLAFVSQRSIERLRRLTTGVLWLLFFLTYLPRVLNRDFPVGGTRQEFITGLVIVAGLGMWQLYVSLANYSRKKVKVNPNHTNPNN